MHDLQMRQTVGLIVTEVNTTGSFHSLPHTLTQTQPKRDIINLTQEQNCLRQIDAGNDVSHARCASTRIENCKGAHNCVETDAQCVGTLVHEHQGNRGEQERQEHPP
eukprot:COSAG06_NODE_50521_length_318_cov_0.707763_1_plen_106_part_11